MNNARLERMKKLREEALLSPEENKLYIEDLNLSISYWEKNRSKKEVELFNGFEE